MKRLVGLLGALSLSASVFAAPVAWNGTGANDWVNWGSLGAEGTMLGTSFAAASGNAVAVSGTAGAAGSTLGSVGGSTVGWAPANGFNAGDNVIWTNDGNVGTGPLGFSFTGMEAAGFYVQADNNFNSFTVELDYLLVGGGTGSLFFNSDGDGVFVGVENGSLANIVGIQVSLSKCTPIDVGNTCDLNDFAINTMNLRAGSGASGALPVPATLPLALLGLVALGRQRRNRSV